MNSPTKFLSGKDILTEISKELCYSKGADLAIAYWGAGALETLGIDRIAGPVRIICDAESGGCNPEELTRLLDTENVHVKTKE